MNKKERRLALATTLQSAAPDIVTVRDLKVKKGANDLQTLPGCDTGDAMATRLSMYSHTKRLRSLQSEFSSGPKTQTLVSALAKVGASPDKHTLLILSEQVSSLSCAL